MAKSKNTGPYPCVYTDKCMNPAEMTYCRPHFRHVIDLEGLDRVVQELEFLTTMYREEVKKRSKIKK